MSVNDKHLAQTLVEGYYALVGNQQRSVVVCLSDVGISHYFKLRLSTGKAKLEVVWHHKIALPNYPPKCEEYIASLYICSYMYVYKHVYMYMYSHEGTDLCQFSSSLILASVCRNSST